MRLVVFDFDRTLFRTPDKPAWWPWKGYWGKVESLAPPHIPTVPGKEWWNAHVVAQVHAANAQADTMCVMLTGRLERVFRDRVQGLLRSQGLSFHECHFQPGHQDTFTFKVGVIERLLLEHGPVTSLEIWEDRAEHVDAFRAHAAQKQWDATVHHVVDAAMEMMKDAV